jgi:hypothetical protein
VADGKKKESKANNEARRKILKAISGAGGVMAAGGILPHKWSRPLVDAVLLPAHAQTSACTEPCQLSVQVEWYTGDDCDLMLVTPGGTEIHPKATPQSACLQHDGDHGDTLDNTQIETVSTIGCCVNPGTYRLYFDNDLATSVDWTITGCNLDIGDNTTIGSTNQRTLLETFTVPGP